MKIGLHRFPWRHHITLFDQVGFLYGLLTTAGFAHLKNQPDLLAELLEDRSSYGETFFVPVRARWHETWRDESGDLVQALKDLKFDIGNMLKKAITAVEDESSSL